MKNILMVLILLIGLSYYLIPYETKVELLNKVWIDSSFLPSEVVEVKKWEVIKLSFDENNKDSFNWNISNWTIVENLSWASLQYVKCFYKDDYKNFEWNTVHHRVLLWKRKNIEVKLIPSNENSNLSMYIYKTEALSKVFPPEKEYVHDCKVDFNSSNNIIKMNWNTVTSDIIIWVSWANWILDWGYTLEIEEK